MATSTYEVTKSAQAHIDTHYKVKTRVQVLLSSRRRMDIYTITPELIVVGEVKTGFGDAKKLRGQLRAYYKDLRKSYSQKIILYGILDNLTYAKIQSKDYPILDDLQDLKLENAETRLLVVNVTTGIINEYSDSAIMPAEVKKEKVTMENQKEGYKVWSALVEACSQIKGQEGKVSTKTGVPFTVVEATESRIVWTTPSEGKDRLTWNGFRKTYFPIYEATGSLSPKDYGNRGSHVLPLLGLLLGRSKSTVSVVADTRRLKVISLVSGGPDCILATHRLLKQGHEVLMMYADYGHPAVEPERKACLDYLALFQERFPGQVSYHEIKIDIRGPKKVESAWGRTFALIGCAQMYNYSQYDNAYNAIAHGSHKGDWGPDVRVSHFSKLQEVFKATTLGTVELLMPIEELDLEGIGYEFKAENLPIELTYDCYWGTPCGYISPHMEYRCQGCRRKMVTMKAMGYEFDPKTFMPNSTRRSFQSPLVEGLAKY